MRFSAPRRASAAVLLAVASLTGMGPVRAGADAAPGTWTAASTLGSPRAGHTASLLDGAACQSTPPPANCGKVLVAGGHGADGMAVDGAQVLDPASLRWSPTGNLKTPRSSHTATVLPNGSVLATGGVDGSGKPLAATEVFRPQVGAGVWGTVGPLASARAGHTATLLKDGRVLVAGGRGAGGAVLTTTEAFDPTLEVVGAFRPTGALTGGRAGHAAVLLADGRVLVAGGTDGSGRALATTELYDPATGTWAAGPPMGAPRATLTATARPDGTVLVVGGTGSELFDPALAGGRGGWRSAAPLTTARTGHTATLLGDGRVLVAGGTGADGAALATTEVWAATDGVWHPSGPLIGTRAGHAAAGLSDGRRVVVAGGRSGPTVLATAEVYDASATVQPPSVTGVLPAVGPVRGGTAVTVRGAGLTGATRVSFGDAAGTTLRVVSATELTVTTPAAQQPTTVDVTVTTSNGTSAKVDGAAFRYIPAPAVDHVEPNAGDQAGGTVVAVTGTAIGFAGTSVLFGDVPAPNVTIVSEAAVRAVSPPHAPGVVDVTVLTPGGTSEPSLLTRFTYGDGSWAPTGSLGTARYLATSTPLADGRVLVAGGTPNFRPEGGSLDSAEIYDPATGQWQATGSLNVSRHSHTATRLADGRVLVAGGASAEAEQPLREDVMLDLLPQPWGGAGYYANGVTQTFVASPASGPVVRAALSADPPAGAAVMAGDPVTFALAVFNTGSANASGVVPTIALPPELDFVPEGGGRYDAANRSVVFPALSVPAGTDAAAPAARFSAMARVRADVADVTPQLAVALHTPIATVARVDGRPSNTVSQFFTDAALVSGAPDVYGAWSSSPAPGSTVAGNTQITYTLKYFNAGGADADGENQVTFGRKVPTGTRFVSASGDATFADGLEPTVTFKPVPVPAGTSPAHPAGTLTFTVTVVPQERVTRRVDSAEVFDPSTGRWTVTASLLTGRFSHTATLLDGPACRAPVPPAYCGRVLVTGGTYAENGRAPIASSELYDPATGTWSATGPLDQACSADSASCGRGSHTATPLPDGKVLVAGGLGYGDTIAPTTAETKVGLTPTVNGVAGPLTTHGFIDTAPAAPQVRVVVTSDPPIGAVVAPGARITYTLTYFNNASADAKDVVLEFGGGASLLEWVSVTGGAQVLDNGRIRFPARTVAANTTLSSPAGRFIVEGRVATRVPHSPNSPATQPVPDGTILRMEVTTGSENRSALEAVHVIEGARNPGASLHLATTADPPSGTVVGSGTTISYSVAYFNTGASAANGAVINAMMPGSAEFVRASDGGTYDPETRRVTFPARPVAAGTTASRPAGAVTIEAKIVTPPRPLETAVVYDPATGRWAPTGAMATARFGHSSVLLTVQPCGDSCGNVLVAGGVERLTSDSSGRIFTASSELYDPRAGTWRRTAGTMGTARGGHSAALLPTGNVLAAGNSMLFPDAGAAAALAAAETFDPVTGRWRDTAPMNAARGLHAVASLDGTPCRATPAPRWCGTVLVAGGAGTGSVGVGARAPSAIASAELYTVASLPPAVSALTPAEGPSAGGTEVRLGGIEFADVSAVTFGATPADRFVVVSRTEVRAVAPPHRSGPVDVTVLAGGGQSEPALAGRFTYNVSQAPAEVTDLAVHADSTTELTLSFSAVLSDGPFPPPAANYIVKQSTSPITDEARFSSATTLCGQQCSFAPTSVGQRLTLTVGDLTPGTTYHYAVKAVNAVNQASLPSDTASATTAQAPAPATTATSTPTTLARSATTLAPAPPAAAPVAAASEAQSPAAPAEPAPDAPTDTPATVTPAPAREPEPEPGTALRTSAPGPGTPGAGAPALALGAPTGVTSTTTATGRGLESASRLVTQGGSGGHGWQHTLVWVGLVGGFGAAGAALNYRLRR